MKSSRAACCLLAIVCLAPPARAADSGLEAVETLSISGRFDKYPSVAFDASGDLWCAFTTTEGGNDRVVVRRRKDGVWSDEARLDAGDGLETGAKLVLDGKNRLRAFWHGKRKGGWAVYSRTRSGGEWGPERKISSKGSDALHPVVTLDASRRLWVAWEEFKRGRFRDLARRGERVGVECAGSCLQLPGPTGVPRSPRRRTEACGWRGTRRTPATTTSSSRGRGLPVPARRASARRSPSRPTRRSTTRRPSRARKTARSGSHGTPCAAARRTSFERTATRATRSSAFTGTAPSSLRRARRRPRCRAR